MGPRLSLWLLLALGSGGCVVVNNGTATLTSSAELTQSLALVTAVWVPRDDYSNFEAVFGLEGRNTKLMLAGTPHVCNVLTQGDPPGSPVLIMELSKRGAAGKLEAATDPGVYSVMMASDEGLLANVTFADAQTSQCSNLNGMFFQGGSVTLTSIESTGASGRFDLVDPLGGHTMGTFTALECTALGDSC